MHFLPRISLMNTDKDAIFRVVSLPQLVRKNQRKGSGHATLRPLLNLFMYS
jgi:hypothetical protein